MACEITQRPPRRCMGGVRTLPTDRQVVHAAHPALETPATAKRQRQAAAAIAEAQLRRRGESRQWWQGRSPESVPLDWSISLVD